MKIKNRVTRQIKVYGFIHTLVEAPERGVNLPQPAYLGNVGFALHHIFPDVRNRYDYEKYFAVVKKAFRSL